MNQATRNKILKYIYDRYTGQEIIEALQTECPNTIKELKKVVPKKINYQSYIDKLTLRNKERIEIYARQSKYYLIYKLLLDKWLR